MTTNQVESFITESVQRLIGHQNFIAWRNGERLNPGDVVLINNSFVFRDVKTNKADEFLALVFKNGSTGPDIAIARDIRFNVDFKRMPSTSTNLLTTSPLVECIGPQLEKLGHLVFLLIGEVQDTEVVAVPLNHNAFASVVWDPTRSESAQIDGNRIIVNRTDDEQLVLTALERAYTASGAQVPEGLRESLGVALDQLQDLAVAKVRIPQAGEDAPTGITDSILAVLCEQREEYENAVSGLTGGATGTGSSFNDVLRLAYNFASDATGYLRLIVSICDLKPIVLWGTIAEHYALSVAFHSLPWGRSNRKPSLKNYQQSIADARNSAFHNLFPFRKTLRVPLPEKALGAPELQIFSEHSKKSSNQLTYNDKELVDVLVEFTRARERCLPVSFWEKNLDVMNATIALFETTSQFLKLLAAARGPNK